MKKQKAERARQEAKARREAERAAKEKAKQEARAGKEAEKTAREKARQEAKEAKAIAKQEAKEAKQRAKQKAEARKKAERAAWLKARWEAKPRREAEREVRERARWQRPTVLIITLVLLAASIFGVYRAFTLPTEIEENTTLLSYQHEGNFDYLVYLKPSYLFGTIPPRTTGTPLPNPRYPAEMIDTFDLIFTYRFVADKPVAKTTHQVEVTAKVESAEGSQEFSLVPKTTKTGDFTVDFSLDDIDFTSTGVITVNAYVYTAAETDSGRLFDVFTHSLDIHPDGRLIEVDRDLSNSQTGFGQGISYEHRGEYDYEVNLKSDSTFGAITLTPPPVTAAAGAPPTILKPGDTILTNLVDRMDMTFAYYLESSRPVSPITEQVKIVAILENPGYWSKDFVPVPLTLKQGDFSVSFPLDISQFTDSIKAIEQETGVSGVCNLTIRADVSTAAQTDFGPIDEDFQQTLTSTLGGGSLKWEEELVKSTPGSIERSQMVTNPNKYLGLPITGARALSATTAGVMLGLFLYFLRLYMRFKPAPLLGIEKEVQLARKKYKELIVDVEELPDIRGEETVISLSSLDDLIRTAEELLKPVLHKGEKERHTYCAIDGLVRYQYVSQLEPSGKDKPTSDG